MILEITISVLLLSAAAYFIWTKVRKKWMTDEYNEIQKELGDIQDYTNFLIARFNSLIDEMAEAEAKGETEEWEQLNREYENLEPRLILDAQIPTQEIQERMREFQRKWNVDISAMMVPIGGLTEDDETPDFEEGDADWWKN